MSDFGSSSNTSKGFNEIKSAGGNGAKVDSSKSMYGGTNEGGVRQDPKYKTISTGQNDSKSFPSKDSTGLSSVAKPL